MGLLEDIQAAVSSPSKAAQSLPGILVQLYDAESVRLIGGERIDRRVNQDVTIELEEGTVADFTAEGLHGTKTLTVQGTWAPATPAQGPASGTAVAGTTTTQLSKDAGTTAWVVGALRELHLRITSGPAAGEVRVVKTNAEHTITVDAITGLDSGAGYELVFPGTIIPTTTIRRCTPTVRFVACQLLEATIEDCIEVIVDGGEVYDFTANRVNHLDLDNVLNSGTVSISDCLVVDVQGVSNDATWAFSDCGRVNVIGDALEASATPFVFTRCNVFAGIASSDNTGDGVSFVSCPHVEPAGLGLTGEGNTGYGARFGGGGYYDMTGATITGDTNDFIIEDSAVTWASLATNQSYIKAGLTVLVIGG